MFKGVGVNVFLFVVLLIAIGIGIYYAIKNKWKYLLIIFIAAIPVSIGFAYTNYIANQKPNDTVINKEVLSSNIEIRKEQVNNVIPFSVITKDDYTLAKGSTNVIQEGVNGERIIKYEVTYKNGVEQNRKELSNVITNEPVEQIVAYGMYVVPPISPTSQNNSNTSIDDAKVALSSVKAITAFTIPSQIGTTTIDESDYNITLTVPYNTNLTALTPTITFTGASIDITSETARDFTNPVTYKVYAADGTYQQYVVTVAIAASSAKEIINFNCSTECTVNTDGTNISVVLPDNLDPPYYFIPTIEVSLGATVSPESLVGHNFLPAEEPHIYRVTAADGSTKDYTVSVSVDGFLNVYPWNNSNCPMSGYLSTGGADGSGGDGYGYGCRQSASYVAWRINKETGNYYSWGNPVNFTANAIAAGYIEGTAQAGSIAVMDPIKAGSIYGHVAWVEAAGGGMVTISQYGYDYGAGYGMYSMMTLSENAFDHYVQIK